MYGRKRARHRSRYLGRVKDAVASSSFHIPEGEPIFKIFFACGNAIKSPGVETNPWFQLIRPFAFVLSESRIQRLPSCKAFFFSMPVRDRRLTQFPAQ